MSRPRRYLASAPILLLAAIALLVGIPAARDSVEQRQESSSATIEVRASFGACHEGGGRNCVVDGDTIWLGGQKVRIAGIDAPETHEPRCPREAELGKTAAERLRALLNSGTVLATPAGRDKDSNGRLLRDVAVDGRDVGKALINEGLARAYGGRKRGWC